MTLSDEQQETIRELRAEVRDLELQADAKWAEYIKTGDEECRQAVLSLDGEAAMMGLVSYVPKAGERKIDKIRGLMGRIRGGAILLGAPTENRVRSLEQINEWRTTYDLPPLDRLPRGTPGSSTDCTLAKAFSLSLEELGCQQITVKVSDGDDISVGGYNPSLNQWLDERPKLGSAGSSVISAFDQCEYVDLMDDDVLHEKLNDDDTDLDYRQVFADELVRRGESTTVGMYLHHSGTGADLGYHQLRVEAGAPSLMDQVEAVEAAAAVADD